MGGHNEGLGIDRVLLDFRIESINSLDIAVHRGCPGLYWTLQVLRTNMGLVNLNPVNCPAEGCSHKILSTLVQIARRQEANSTFPHSGFLGNTDPPAGDWSDQPTHDQQDRCYICLEQDFDQETFVHRQYALNRGIPPETTCLPDYWHVMAESSGPHRVFSHWLVL